MSLRGISLSKSFVVRRNWPFEPTYKVAVDSVSFELVPGRTLGVVGQSGSGKSTLARLAVGLLQPTAGHVEFEGRRIDAFNPAEQRRFCRAVQPIFQDPRSALNWKLSIESIVTEPLLNFGERDRRARRRRAADLLEQVRLSRELLDRRPPDVSGGQLQRVAIARSLALDPQYLICDEPLSALDVSVQAGVVNLLLELQQSRGLAMMFISHDLEIVRHVSDHVLVIHRGRVVAEEAAGALYESGKHEHIRMLLERAAVAGSSVNTDAL